MNPNDLLTWASAKTTGTWARFRAAIDELQLRDSQDKDDDDVGGENADSGSLPIHHRFRRNLERLGHVEFFRPSFENGWRVVPPILAGTDAEEGACGVLCGARTDMLLEQLNSNSSILDIHHSSQAEAPDRIAVMSESDAELNAIAASLDLQYVPRAAYTLLASIPPVDNKQMRLEAELPFGNDWEVHRFSISERAWRSVPTSEVRSTRYGLFRFQLAYRRQYFVQLRAKSFKVPVEVGKYLLLKHHRFSTLSYNASDETLSMPVTFRPPLPVDRGLTLCSGRIPDIENGQLVYKSVTKETALLAKSLLRQT